MSDEDDKQKFGRTFLLGSLHPPPSSRIPKRSMAPKVPHDVAIDEDGNITVGNTASDIAAKLRKALAARFPNLRIPPDPHLPALLKSRGARAGVIQTPFHSDDILKGFGKPVTGALRSSLPVGTVVAVDPNDPSMVNVTLNLPLPPVKGVVMHFTVDDPIPAERFLFTIQLDPPDEAEEP